MPTRSDRTAIQDLVVADIQQRKAIGVERYGSVLQSFNGRNVARDKYEEDLDGLMYSRQLLEQWEVMEKVIEAAVDWRVRNPESLKTLAGAVDSLLEAGWKPSPA